MEFLNRHIPQEYLALKINYCRQQLELLPKVTMKTHILSGVPTQLLFVDGHRFKPDSKSGEQSIRDMERRSYLERELQIYEAIWYSKYKDDPFPECTPHNANRTLYIDTKTQVVLNREYFDSLKNDANTKQPKPTDYPFDGMYYRSAAERDIAMFYTEMGIPFKYEPEVTIKGITGFIYPDFVPYFEEIDNCKFHEHFGIKNSSGYNRVTSIKYVNYANAGLVSEADVIYTHDTDDMPFDIRAFSSKLNTAIYGTVISTKQSIPAS